ncbi:MAG: thioredoxin family protein [Burkholderiaceae bacterium]|nr:thioredoxin family protein [Burkholderiaceae bacterium]
MSSVPAVHVACLCAAWCRTCDEYRPAFDAAVNELRRAGVAVTAHWIDIEDEADLIGDYDVETFPTLLVADAQRVHFIGPLTPQAETLRRLLRATVLDASGAPLQATPAIDALAAGIRRRTGD